MHTKDFYLHEEEEVIEGLEPVYDFRRYLLVRWFIILESCGIIALASAYMANDAFAIGEFATYLKIPELLILAWTGVSLAASFVISKLEWKKRFYWITNHRLIISHGIIRHCVLVTNLYEISEMDMTRTYLQRKLRSTGLKIESRRGNFSMGGIPEPEGIYLELRGLIKERRRQEGLIF